MLIRFGYQFAAEVLSLLLVFQEFFSHLLARLELLQLITGVPHQLRSTQAILLAHRFFAKLVQDL